MIDFDKVTIDLTYLPAIEAECMAHANANPACVAHSHWQNSQANDRLVLGASKKFAALNWLGHGYPARFDRRMEMEDYLELEKEYAQPDTLDCQSALHQFYQIGNFCPETDDLWIIDIGGGYGRLAIPYFLAFKDRVHYRSVDYVPLSMCVAPQVMEQLCPGCDFQVIPAWRIGELADQTFHLGISTHSLQEMTRPAVGFYLGELRRLLRPDGFFYSVNQQPDFEEGLGYRPHSEYNYPVYFSFAFVRHYLFNFGPYQMLEIGMVQK